MVNLKRICITLSDEFCFYRSPIRRFTEAIGKENTEWLVKKGYLKFSKGNQFVNDYREDCFEYSKKFRFIFNWYNRNSVWSFIKYDILHWIEIRDRIKDFILRIGL